MKIFIGIIVLILIVFYFSISKSNEWVQNGNEISNGNESYIIEVLIPWDLIKLDVKGGNKINTTSFEPKNGAEIALLPCVINCKDGGATLEAAYKFKGTSFTVSQFVPGKLVD